MELSVDADVGEEKTLLPLRTCRVIEFFSGIGGWRCALTPPLVATSDLEYQYVYEVVEAFDINTKANMIYEHSFHHSPNTKSIERITVRELNKLAADMWVMSPPCQPFTRNNETDHRDNKDTRCNAFLRIIQLLNDNTMILPRYILLENVIGFETSESCKMFLEALQSNGYIYYQFLLTPLQFGIPNSRPRYYCVAVRTTQTSLATVAPCSDVLLDYIPSFENVQRTADSLSSFLKVDQNSEEYGALLISKEVLAKSSSWCFDIVSPNSTRTACFTKGYGRYAKGTGSVLLLSTGIPLEKIEGEPCDTQENKKQKFEESTNSPKRLNEDLILRYFSPRELLGLFGFPESFTYPPQCANRQLYECIGNSINVTVVRYLVLFSSKL